jgi:predicted MPP superfamily phosphohydrolase
MLNALAPELVVLTGDYVCLSPKPLGAHTEALRALKRPCFATLGNHDHWCDAGRVQAALERAGVDVLRNEHRVLRLGAGTLHLVGVDDSVTRHDDPQAAFDGVPEGATTVVLSHDPNSADGLLPFQPSLILSGHTHGGQVFVKRLTPFMAKRIGIRYLHGFFELDGAVLYVNRGLGAGIPLRIGAPVEVAQLTLRSGASAPSR